MISSNIAEIQVSYSLNQKSSDLVTIKSSKETYSILQQIWSKDIDYREEFLIILLSRASKILGYYVVSKGGMHGTLVDPKIIFQIALKSHAGAIILAHNHPSGNLKPSPADIELTRKIKSVSEFLELHVLDHLIITSESYYSFADEGIL